MDQYIVSARKYRPATFHSVVGQKALTSTLKNAISGKRIAQAYLFTGPRGVGKTSCARIFAKTINCLNPTPEGEACGVCESCRDIAEGNSYNIVELDAASNNSVNDIRNITEQVNVPPQVGSYRVFIIDEVHMLSSAAFNAFLKTLEEPPKYVVFILATTEKHKVLPTILSRCQIYDFKRITISDMVEHLQYVASEEGITADPKALGVIARKADGAMRDALSIFDQVSAYCGGNITYENTIANLNVLDYDYYFRLVEAFRAGNVPASLLIFNEILDKGFDPLFFVGGLAAHVRDLMMAADPSTVPLLEVGQDIAEQYVAQAKSLPLQWYYKALQLLDDCEYRYRTSTSRRLLVELTLIRLGQMLTPPTPPFDRVDAGIPLQPVIPTPQAPASTQAAPPPTVATSAPAASAAAPAPPAVGASRRRGSRLGDMMRAAEAETRRHESRRNPFTAEDFTRAWLEFADANPDRQSVVASMRRNLPVCKEGETYIAQVDNPGMLAAFESVMPALLEFIRGRLSNDFAAVELQLSKEATVKKLPDSELLRQIVQDNPGIATLLREIDAELE
ncbi:MAG: DNA polymerase III subunit gamma/tau [Muribaculaceae bacterium]|nr:DNA polymerase III subunit gamma/tau [Muribaculaceae bacterium]